MKPSPHILNELEAISPMLASMEKLCVFEVPDKYFDTLDKTILAQVNNPFLSRFTDNEHKSLTVPASYFDNLSTQILNKIKQHENESAGIELRSLSPMLYSIQNENIFTVPDGYFKNLSADVLYKVQPQKAKVVAMPKRTNIFRYAAAVITGIIGISSLLMFNKAEQQPIATKVIEAPAIPAYVQQSYQYKNEHDVSEGISKLSDDEIVKYLQTTGSDADDQALNTSLEEKDLPAQKDYLLDEKALDSYLNKIDANSTN